MTELNLVRDPWIEALYIRDDGGTEVKLAGLREVLMNAHRIESVRAPRVSGCRYSMYDYAIYRLLATIVMDAFRTGKYSPIMEEGLFDPDGKLGRYLDTYEDRFDMTGERPFLQATKKDIGEQGDAAEADQLTMLFQYIAPSLNGQRFGNTLMAHSTRFNVRDTAYAVLLNAFGAKGIGGHGRQTVNSKTAIFTLMEGRNLFETILFACVDCKKEENEPENIPAWRWDDRFERLNAMRDPMLLEGMLFPTKWPYIEYDENGIVKTVKLITAKNDVLVEEPSSDGKGSDPEEDNPNAPEEPGETEGSDETEETEGSEESDETKDAKKKEDKKKNHLKEWLDSTFKESWKRIDPHTVYCITESKKTGETSYDELNFHSCDREILGILQHVNLKRVPGVGSTLICTTKAIEKNMKLYKSDDGYAYITLFCRDITPPTKQLFNSAVTIRRNAVPMLLLESEEAYENLTKLANAIQSKNGILTMMKSAYVDYTLSLRGKKRSDIKSKKEMARINEHVQKMSVSEVGSTYDVAYNQIVTSLGLNVERYLKSIWNDSAILSDYDQMISSVKQIAETAFRDGLDAQPHKFEAVVAERKLKTALNKKRF